MTLICNNCYKRYKCDNCDNCDNRDNRGKDNLLCLPAHCFKYFQVIRFYIRLEPCDNREKLQVAYLILPCIQMRKMLPHLSSCESSVSECNWILIKPCLLKCLMVYFLGVENYLVIWKQGAVVDGISKAFPATRF